MNVRRRFHIVGNFSLILLTDDDKDMFHCVSLLTTARFHLPGAHPVQQEPKQSRQCTKITRIKRIFCRGWSMPASSPMSEFSHQLQEGGRREAKRDGVLESEPTTDFLLATTCNLWFWTPHHTLRRYAARNGTYVGSTSEERRSSTTRADCKHTANRV